MGVFQPIDPRQQITSSPFSIQTRGIFVNDAKQVGIGTDAPTAQMDVVARSAPATIETILRAEVDDAPGDFFQIKNWTPGDGKFYSFLWGHHQSDDRNALQFLATTSKANDVGSEAMMVFETSVSDGVSLQGPIVNRPLFRWVDLFFLRMTMTANGRLGIGRSAPESPLHLGLSADASRGIFLGKAGTGHGTRLSVRGTNNQIFGIDIDPNNVSGLEQFEVTYNGGSAVFVIDEDGEVGVGTSSPQVPLHVEGGTNATLSSGGFVQAGSTSGTNVVIDDDQIMARNNGATSRLYFNANGGTVVFGGDVDLDVNVVRSQSTAAVNWAFCPAGQLVIGGGCQGGDDKVQTSRPTDSGNAWLCHFTGDFNNSDGFAWAICANVE